jgi:endonuclease V-like protein UPF0215 family
MSLGFLFDVTAGNGLIPKGFRVVKPEIRVLGVDDGIFEPRSGGFATVVGVVFRGGYWLDGVMHTKIKVDGLDAGEKIANMILGSPHFKQLRVVMLNGVTFAGFNVVDIKKLNEATGLPMIAATRDKPDEKSIREALKNLPKSGERWKAMRGGGKMHAVQTRAGAAKVYVQVACISLEDATKILRLTSTRSNMPEALRVAHIIASGLTAT